MSAHFENHAGQRRDTMDNKYRPLLLVALLLAFLAASQTLGHEIGNVDPQFGQVESPYRVTVDESGDLNECRRDGNTNVQGWLRSQGFDAVMPAKKRTGVIDKGAFYLHRGAAQTRFERGGADTPSGVPRGKQAAKVGCVELYSPVANVCQFTGIAWLDFGKLLYAGRPVVTLQQTLSDGEVPLVVGTLNGDALIIRKIDSDQCLASSPRP